MRRSRGRASVSGCAAANPHAGYTPSPRHLYSVRKSRTRCRTAGRTASRASRARETRRACEVLAGRKDARAELVACSSARRSSDRDPDEGRGQNSAGCCSRYSSLAQSGRPGETATRTETAQSPSIRMATGQSRLHRASGVAREAIRGGSRACEGRPDLAISRTMAEAKPGGPSASSNLPSSLLYLSGWLCEDWISAGDALADRARDRRKRRRSKPGPDVAGWAGEAGRSGAL